MYGSIAAIFPMDDGACITVSTLARCSRNLQRSHTNSVDQSICLASFRIYDIICIMSIIHYYVKCSTRTAMCMLDQQI